MRAALPRLGLAALLAAGCAGAPAPPPPIAGPAARPDALEVMAELERRAREPVWPGFDPLRVPVALHDGGRTLLFRHPSPPPGFTPLPGAPGVLVYPGRHPAVQANSSVELGGVATATVLLPAGEHPLAEVAGLVAHETFHVHQRARHPGWMGNEAEIFTYPVARADLLLLRRLESEALRRALAAESTPLAACRARAAVGIRAERFAAMPAGAAAYETGTELNEGLARYVGSRVAGGGGEVIPAGEFAPHEVRDRAYATGHALALLLDRFAPGWKEEMEAGAETSLHERLGAALAPEGTRVCGFAPAERAAARERAERDAAAHEGSLRAAREAFLGAEGWRIVVEAGTEPLWPKWFDPLNLRPLPGGEVLHTRNLEVANAAGSLGLFGRAALTEPAGEHPLFQGVRRVTVTGLAARPEVRDSLGVLVVEGEGVSARLRGSQRTEGRTLVLRLP